MDLLGIVQNHAHKLIKALFLIIVYDYAALDAQVCLFKQPDLNAGLLLQHAEY
jgi:hypothetical protein